MRRSVLVGLAVLAVLAVAAASARAAVGVKVHGKITKVAAEGASFEVRAKGGTYKVTVPEDAALTRHALVTLGDVPAGTTIWVLGKKQDSDGTAAGTMMLTNVRAIVVGDHERRPPVPEALQKTGVDWVSGQLQFQGTQVWIEQRRVVAGADRMAIRIEPAERAALKKGAAVMVDGEAEDLRSKDVTARAIVVVAPNVPPAEHLEAFGY